VYGVSCGDEDGSCPPTSDSDQRGRFDTTLSFDPDLRIAAASRSTGRIGLLVFLVKGVSCGDDEDGCCSLNCIGIGAYMCSELEFSLVRRL